MARLGKNRYGKSRVRLSRITRHADRHDFQEWTVHVLLEGDFEASYTEGDNRIVLPTDTMKNTVYAVAGGSSAQTIEAFAMELGDFFLERQPQVSGVSIKVEEKAWERVQIRETPEPTTFQLRGGDLQTVQAERSRGGRWAITSGVEGLTILKTDRSAFTGFLEDALTTLKPTTDRILGTSASARWEFGTKNADYATTRERILRTLLQVFAAHESKSVQHTLFDMGKAALDAAPEIARITLTMPNLHHLLADLGRFGLENPNHIFVPIDEPHGTIEATVER